MGRYLENWMLFKLKKFAKKNKVKKLFLNITQTKKSRINK